ncbi:unnamed protein product [Calypogeia fissa]
MVRGLSKALRHAGKDLRKFSRGDDNEDNSWRGDNSSRNRSGPRSFPHDVKDACWRQASVVKGRDPERWRRDALGNLVFQKLVGCQGCLCYNYDHVVPYSKGGKSTLENCQVLQTAANSAKGARTSVSTTELMQRSAYCHLSRRDMDMMEVSAYGDVHHENDGGFSGCRMQ